MHEPTNLLNFALFYSAVFSTLGGLEQFDVTTGVFLCS